MPQADGMGTIDSQARRRGRRRPTRRGRGTDEPAHPAGMASTTDRGSGPKMTLYSIKKGENRTMKTMKKIGALTIVMMMVLAMSTSVFAQTITITPPSGIDATTSNSYDIYKVFDATVDATDNTKVNYTLCAGDTLSAAMTAAGFFVDDGGNVHYGTFTEAENGTYMVGGKKGNITEKTELADDAIAAIAAYVTDSDKVDTATSTGTANAVSKDLPNGYYYITTTTGTVVTIDSNNNTTPVQDKNTIPGPPDKSITDASSMDEAGQNAIAEVGKVVTFPVTIEKVKGAKNYVFHDTMTTGFVYNNDVVVKVGESTIAPSTTVNTDADNETFTVGATGTDTLTLTFDNDWLAGLTDGTKISITYSAQVTSDALSVNAAENTATLEYGNGSKTEGDTVKVYNAKFTVNKTDGTAALPGAGFVVKNSAGKYYKLNPKAEADDAATVGLNEAAGPYVTWVDAIADATEYVSAADGTVGPFTGLADGTYTLEEKTVPTGYNKAADSTFEIKAADFSQGNLEQSSTVINNKGTELPSTGGIGTTILYIVGSLLVLGAGVVLVTKRRMN